MKPNIRTTGYVSLSPIWTQSILIEFIWSTLCRVGEGPDPCGQKLLCSEERGYPRQIIVGRPILFVAFFKGNDCANFRWPMTLPASGDSILWVV